MAPPPPYGLPENIPELNAMFSNIRKEIVAMKPEAVNWKTQRLPIARIKRLMKQEEAIIQELEKERREREEEQDAVESAPVSRLMIAGDAPIVMQKACEFMVMELAVRSWRHTKHHRRRTLQRQDVQAAVGENEMFDFLIDLVPRALPSGPPPPAEVPSVPAETTTAPTETHLQGAVGYQQQQQQQQQQMPGAQQPQGAAGFSDVETRYAQLQEMQNQMQEHYSLMQERAMVEGNVPMQGLAQEAAAGQFQQPQVVLNPQLMIHPPDGAAMPQWHPPASSREEPNNEY